MPEKPPRRRRRLSTNLTLTAMQRDIDRCGDLANGRDELSSARALLVSTIASVARMSAGTSEPTEEQVKQACGEEHQELVQSVLGYLYAGRY